MGLLQSRVDINECLAEEVQKGNPCPRKVKKLLKAGADPNIMVRGMPLLNLVRKPTIVLLLLQGNADPNMVDGQGRSAVFGASGTVLELLLSYGGKLDVLDNDGKMAIEKATTYQEHRDLLYHELKRKCEFGLSERLIYAKSDEEVKLLVAAGADPNKLVMAYNLNVPVIVPLSLVKDRDVAQALINCGAGLDEIIRSGKSYLKRDVLEGLIFESDVCVVPHVIRDLEVTREMVNDLRDTCCAICLDDCYPGGSVILRCGHGYHTDCFKLWMEQVVGCPQCDV